MKNKVFRAIKEYFKNCCWHNYEMINSFTKSRQNDYERPIIVESQKCVKCGRTREQYFWKDLH